MMADRKLIEVPVARFDYRHEAEFAAGFLEDAGIPYRLQIDDPALGISVGVAATLWVRGMDADEARDLLEIDHRPISLTRHRPSPPKRAGQRARRPRAQAAASGRRGPSVGRPARHPGLPRLAFRERGVALVLSGGTLALTWGVTNVSSPAAAYVGAGIAAILAVAGLGGRAPASMKRWLSALAGNAP